MKAFSADNHPGPATYLGGFVLALLLTLLAFGIARAGTGIAVQPINFVLAMLAHGEQVPRPLMAGSIWTLAVLQMAVHLRYFLHLDFSPRQRLNVLTLLFSLSIIFILVCGTLWIMQDLGNQMSPHSSGKIAR